MPNSTNADLFSSTASTATFNDIYTPSSTSIEGSSEVQWLQSSQEISPSHLQTSHIGSLEVTRSAEPVAGNIYIIIAKEQDRALTCRDGNVYLGDSVKEGKSCQWRCIETNGFLGFINVAEGGFLGRNIWWHFYAKVFHHLPWEYFRVQKQPCGGYWIQALHFWKFWQLSAHCDGHGLFTVASGGTIWEFVKVHGLSDI